MTLYLFIGKYLAQLYELYIFVTNKILSSHTAIGLIDIRTAESCGTLTLFGLSDPFGKGRYLLLMSIQP
jgi:hypothetical protein